MPFSTAHISIPKMGAFALSTNCRRSFAIAATCDKIDLAIIQEYEFIVACHHELDFQGYEHKTRKELTSRSLLLDSITSCATPTKPTILFSASLLVVAFTSKYRVSPLLFQTQAASRRIHQQVTSLSTFFCFELKLVV